MILAIGRSDVQRGIEQRCLCFEMSWLRPQGANNNKTNKSVDQWFRPVTFGAFALSCELGIHCLQLNFDFCVLLRFEFYFHALGLCTALISVDLWGTVPARQSAHKRDSMDPAAQLEFVRDNVDADMQFILGESGVSLENQVAIGRHYGTLRKFSALGDDRASIRTSSCLQDFAIPGDTPASRAQTASVVAAWETAKEYMAKEIELKAEAKVLGQPRVLQIHERQAMLRAVEAVHGQLNDSECPSSDYLSLKAEETECNEPSAAPLDEILSKQVSSNSQI